MELDTSARIYCLRSQPAAIPILAFWDFAAAFPSVVHEWIATCLRSCCFPKRFRDIVDGNYFSCCTYMNTSSEEVLLAIVCSGVLQGCPLSGTLFAVAMDPILRKICRDLPEQSGACVRACADDIGGVFCEIRALSRIFPSFEAAEVVAGLSLKPIKCVIVPLHAPFSPQVVDTVQT